MLNLDESRREKEEIKARLIDPLQVCSALGIAEKHKRQPNGIMISCPSHAENNPSCSVQTKDGALLANCHACGWGGDVFELIAKVSGLTLPRDFPRVMERARALAGMSPRIAAPSLSSVAPARDFGAEWAALPPIDADEWEYLRGRGLDEAADYCRAVRGDRLTGDWTSFSRGGWTLAQALRAPDGRVTAIQVRRLTNPDDASAHDDRFRCAGSPRTGVFGEPQKIATAPVVLLCEGFADTLAALIAFRGKPVAVVGLAGTGQTEAVKPLPLTGKSVAVAMHDDAAGDKAAGEIAEILDKRGVPWFRARPPKNSDLADMHAAGANLPAWLEREEGASTGIRSFAVAVKEEGAVRQSQAERIIPLGNPYLNKAFIGLLPIDVLIVGAKVGRGKSELLTGIAAKNAEDGRRVVALYLEGEEYEGERRIKYRLLSSMIWQDPRKTAADRDRFNYRDWRYGKLRDLVGEYEEIADAALAERYRTLRTFYRRSLYGNKDLRRTLDVIKNEAQLVVIDHLHMIDGGDKSNDKQTMRGIAQTILDFARLNEIPIAAAAHLRKPTGAAVKSLAPSEDEFMGAAEISQMATKAVTFAVARGVQAKEEYLSPTYIRIVKNRTDASQCGFVALADFDRRRNAYAPGFVLGRLSPDETEWNACTGEDFPRWAR